jgi:regulator of protease activity HflC (stomatin/prohibitin superfamily)
MLFARLAVMEYQRAVVFADGRLEKTLGPGEYFLSKYFPRRQAYLFDCRLTALAVTGQEILTKDKMPVRMNLTALYRLADPAKAVTKVQVYTTYLYERLQLAAREIVADLTLDELLAKKTALTDELTEKVRPLAAEAGLELASCGVKDVILPGEIKALMIKSVEAEQAAKAALITAREDLAATRVRANTAKLYADPAMLRLKELEIMAELAKKSGNTFIFGHAPMLKAP